MDEALGSRFLRVRVVPEITEWLRWSEGYDIHPSVRDFVGANQGIFADPEANPRAWTYVSQVVTAWESIPLEEQDHPTLDVAVAGFVGDKWGTAYSQVYYSQRVPLNPEEILKNYPARRETVRHWLDRGQLDII